MTDIKTLNDAFRHSLQGGRVMLTCGIKAKTHDEIAEILEKIRSFDNFTTANDPYGEHDFGSFDYKGQKIFFKIDYYDLNYEYMSENPADPTITNQVLIIMLASEY